MAWLGGVAGAGGAVAAGAQNNGSRKHTFCYLLSIVVAVVVFLIVFSQV